MQMQVLEQRVPPPPQRVPPQQHPASEGAEYLFGRGCCRVCGDADNHPTWVVHGAQLPNSAFYRYWCRSPEGEFCTTVCGGCELSLGLTHILAHRRNPAEDLNNILAQVRRYWERKREPIPPPPGTPPGTPQVAPSSPLLRAHRAANASPSTSPSSASLRRAHEEVATSGSPSSWAPSSRTSATRMPSHQVTSSDSGSQGASGDHAQAFTSWGSTQWQV